MKAAHSAVAALMLATGAGCGSESSAVWLEGASYEWAYFNHRLAHLGLSVAGDQAAVAVIGGTSTTGVEPDLDDSCDAGTCKEFPFSDLADVALPWARVTTRDAVFATGTLSVVADADGASTTATIQLDQKARGDVTVILQGFSLDTDYALSGGDACYDPSFGWVPRQIGAAVEGVLSDDGRSVDVTLNATFEAGPTHEEERVCLDAVVDQAQVPFDADVLVVVTKAAAESHAVTGEASYDRGDGGQFSPDQQPDPDRADRPLSVGIDDPLVGWSAFHFDLWAPDGEPDAGVYVRGLRLEASAADGYASGHAWNYSPATQLTGLAYTFDGVVSAADVGGGVERGTLTSTVPATLEDDGVATVYTFELSDGEVEAR